MYDAIVIGVGGMGSAALYHLSLRGARVLGLEQFDIPNDRGSSHGITRIIRLAYWEHPDYVPLVRRAYTLWRELERDTGERLLVITGCVDAGPGNSAHIAGVRHACAAFQLEHQEYDSDELRRRFPGYRLAADTVAIFQPEGGFVRPERCTSAHVGGARRRGAEVRTRERVIDWSTRSGAIHVKTDRGEYDAQQLIVTAGAWTSSLLPQLARSLSPERQVMLWTDPVRPDFFHFDTFPVFYIDVAEGAFYGFPVYEVPGFKIGKYHHRFERVDPDTMDRECHPEDEEALRQAIRRYFPDANGPTLAMKTCLFTNTYDEHFVIDVLASNPRLVVAAGFSGHGYKFCSIVGEILADLALDGGTRHNISLFEVGRLTTNDQRPTTKSPMTDD
jgi:sarcosine oxidase